MKDLTTYVNESINESLLETIAKFFIKDQVKKNLWVHINYELTYIYII